MMNLKSVFPRAVIAVALSSVLLAGCGATTAGGGKLPERPNPYAGMTYAHADQLMRTGGWKKVEAEADITAKNQDTFDRARFRAGQEVAYMAGPQTAVTMTYVPMIGLAEITVVTDPHGLEGATKTFTVVAQFTAEGLAVTDKKGGKPVILKSSLHEYEDAAIGIMANMTQIIGAAIQGPGTIAAKALAGAYGGGGAAAGGGPAIASGTGIGSAVVNVLTNNATVTGGAACTDCPATGTPVTPVGHGDW